MCAVAAVLRTMVLRALAAVLHVRPVITEGRAQCPIVLSIIITAIVEAATASVPRRVLRAATAPAFRRAAACVLQAA